MNRDTQKPVDLDDIESRVRALEEERNRRRRTALVIAFFCMLALTIISGASIYTYGRGQDNSYNREHKSNAAMFTVGAGLVTLLLGYQCLNSSPNKRGQ